MKLLGLALLFSLLGFAPAQAQQVITMPPPAGITVGGLQVVQTCGTASLTAGQVAVAVMDHTGVLCSSASGGGGSVTQGTVPWVTFSAALKGPRVSVTVNAGTGAAAITLPAGSTTTFPIICIDPILPQNEVYYELGAPAATAVIGTSQHLGVTPICQAIGTNTSITAVSAASATLQVTQWSAYPQLGAPVASYGSIQPYGYSQSVNLSLFNGVVPLSGVGISGPGSWRVVTSSDSGVTIRDTSGNTPKVALGNTPAASTDQALVVTQRQADLPLIIDRCQNPYVQKLTAPINISTATTTAVIPLSGSTSIQVCGWSVTISEVLTTANTLQWVYGSGTACATSQVALSGLYGAGGVTAAAPLFIQGAEMSAPGGAGICAITVTGASGSFQGIIFYVQS